MSVDELTLTAPDEAAMVAAAASLLTASVLVPSELDQLP